jgi:hypothetical protein
MIGTPTSVSLHAMSLISFIILYCLRQRRHCAFEFCSHLFIPFQTTHQQGVANNTTKLHPNFSGTLLKS